MDQRILLIIKSNIEKIKNIDHPPDNYYILKNNLYYIQPNKNFNIYKGNGFLYKNNDFLGLYDFDQTNNIYKTELFLNGEQTTFESLELAIYHLWIHRNDNNDVILL